MTKREELLDGSTGWVLGNGLFDLSLRPLAVGIGTSDRMLLYYFKTREALVEAVVAELPARLAERFVPAPTVTPERWVRTAWSRLLDPEHRAALALLHELEALAVRHGAPYRGAVEALRATFTAAATQVAEAAGAKGAAARKAGAAAVTLLLAQARDAAVDGAEAGSAPRDVTALLKGDGRR